jgi:hypothetical protein
MMQHPLPVFFVSIESKGVTEGIVVAYAFRGELARRRRETGTDGTFPDI